MIHCRRLESDRRTRSICSIDWNILHKRRVKYYADTSTLSKRSSLDRLLYGLLLKMNISLHWKLTDWQAQPLRSRCIFSVKNIHKHRRGRLRCDLVFLDFSHLIFPFHCDEREQLHSAERLRLTQAYNYFSFLIHSLSRIYFSAHKHSHTQIEKHCTLTQSVGIRKTRRERFSMSPLCVCVPWAYVFTVVRWFDRLHPGVGFNGNFIFNYTQFSFWSNKRHAKPKRYDHCLGRDIQFSIAIF